MILSITVPGIHCTGCTGRIEKVLSKQSGIISASADVTTKIVFVEYDDAIINEDQIRAAIERLGFTL